VHGVDYQRRHLLFLVLAFFAAGSEVYKWVDEEGVVHYSDTPPEDRQAAEVSIDQPPTEEARRQAEALYQQSIEQAGARKMERELQVQQAGEARQEYLERMTPERERCFEAYLAIEALDQRGTVYQDEAGKVHHWSSLHSFWYESYRKRLDDSDRRDLIRHYRDEMDRYCDMPDREVRSRAADWQRIQLAGQCRMARAKYERLRAESSKTPASTIESARELIEKHCN
jgi:hypothetical protein